MPVLAGALRLAGGLCHAVGLWMYQRSRSMRIRPVIPAVDHRYGNIFAGGHTDRYGPVRPGALMSQLTALTAGILFGIGLAISGMTNPANIIAFLNIAGPWQPALLWVMGSAVLITFIGYRLLGYRSKPWFAAQFHTPAATLIDRRLLTGACLFGCGWGLSGFCPGPAIVSAWLAEPDAWLFLCAYLLGSYAHDWRTVPKVSQFADG